MAVFLSGAQNLAGGASHDGLDIAKMGRKGIRRFGKLGVLGSRGDVGWKEGRREMCKGRQTWRCRWLQWQEKQTGKESARGGGGTMFAKTAATAKNYYLPHDNIVLYKSQ